MSSMQAAVGFAVKSGWTAAVLLAGDRRLPRVIDARRIELSDPDFPEARQPYHDGFGTARRSGPELTRLINSVKRFSGRSVATALAAYREEGRRLTGAALVVGSTIDPDRIANDHIRIHALEGRLFRGVIEDALTASGVACSVWRERDLYTVAARTLKRSEDDLRTALVELRPPGRAAWRAEQKTAALGAWLVLTGSRT